jgi:hypothetical protein
MVDRLGRRHPGSAQQHHAKATVDFRNVRIALTFPESGFAWVTLSMAVIHSTTITGGGAQVPDGNPSSGP